MKTVKRLDVLTPGQQARMSEWSDKWIEVGLRTGPANREAFEKHAMACYAAAGLEPPKRFIWVPSPFVMAFAAPAAALSLEWRKAIEKDSRVAAALSCGIVPSAVDSAVRSAVRSAVGSAVDSAVGSAVRRTDPECAVVDVIRRGWANIIGGQFWVGYGWYGYWGAPAFVSFLREVCGLDLGDDMNARAIAYAGTAESACWWWPHREFVMVCERPIRIERDPQGRLHSLESRAIEWSDGWGVYRVHGTTVPDYVVERPEEITVERIDAEANDEVRRVMVERFGAERFIREAGAKKVQQDEYGTLYERRFERGTPAVFVHLINSTPEADGSRREFWRRVHPELRPLLGDGQLGDPQALTARNAVASTFGLRGEEYAPIAES